MATSDAPLNVPNVTLAVARGASSGGGGDIALPEANLVVDTFETANMTPTLNNTGFSWGTNNRTSIVTMDSATAECSATGPVAVWNNGSTCNQPSDLTKDWAAKNGDYSLRFRYEAIPGTNETMAEQRWAISTPQTDLWLRYWLRVPTNYVKADSGGTTTNDKFLSVWKDTYDVAGTVTWQMRKSTEGATLVYQDGGVTSGEAGSVPFIAIPADRGRWMQIVVHVLSATSDTAADGKIELWRRWENESAFGKLHEKLNADTWESGAVSQAFQAGFILGSHREYQEETEWFVDDFELSDQPLVSAGTEGL